jgi:phosphate starvation-inducible PhoH-like protein
MSEATLTLSDPEVALQLFGPRDQNLRLLRGQFDVDIVHRNGQLRISGTEDSVRLATEVLEVLRDHALRTGRVGTEDVLSAMGRLNDSETSRTQFSNRSFSSNKMDDSISPSNSRFDDEFDADNTRIKFRSAVRTRSTDRTSKAEGTAETTGSGTTGSGTPGSSFDNLETEPKNGDTRGSRGAGGSPSNSRSGSGGSGPGDSYRGNVAIGNAGRQIRPRTDGQAKYVETIRTNSMTFCVGPAGCGKTYLAVAAAVEALKSRQVRKIVLVRPAVEAGESLGFLPGDLQAKLNPYLRPLLDAIGEMVDYDQAKYLMEEETIEVIPLAYMRGRTLNQAFIILDEAQNTTVGQMKMFLTRMGEGSKVVVSGDISQVDLPSGVTSGLRDAAQRLQGIADIGFVKLDQTDIVRHPLVHRIVDAYDSSSSVHGISFKPGDD